MTKRDEALKALLETYAYLAKLRLEQPDNAELRNTKLFLDAVETEFYKGFPIENTDAAFSLSQYNGRVLFDGPYGELSAMIGDLGTKMGLI